MIKVILQAPRYISPFNEPARDLRIQNKPLWLNQQDLLAPYVEREREILPGEHLPISHDPMIVYRDNLWFDESYITEFMRQAIKRNHAVRAAFSMQDTAFREYALPLSVSYTPAGNLLYADLWFYPHGPDADVDPLVIDLEERQVGNYGVPTNMTAGSGDNVYQVPLRAMMAIDSWTHVFYADSIFGLFARKARFENRFNKDLWFKLKINGTALYEGKRLQECSELVTVGRNCMIDRTAIIHGPTTIGDNVIINAGAVIDNCIVGSNVKISQDCQLMLSVVGDGTILPFRASLLMTTIMENGMVAQNTCLQMCVIGRNTFIGAGNTLINNNFIPAPIRSKDWHENLSPIFRPVLGGCVGHNCNVGAGRVISPACTIESDVVLFPTHDHCIVDHDIKYEESDHHKLKDAGKHPRLYPRWGEKVLASW